MGRDPVVGGVACGRAVSYYGLSKPRCRGMSIACERGRGDWRAISEVGKTQVVGRLFDDHDAQFAPAV